MASADAELVRRRRRPQVMHLQNPEQLRVDVESLRETPLDPFCKDLRGNAVPSASIGHIHHPLNLDPARRWVILMDGLLGKNTLRLRPRFGLTYQFYATGQ